MTLNLLEEVKEYFNNEFISEAARNLEESEVGITEALSAILPSTIGLLSNEIRKTNGGEKISKLAADQNKSGVLSALTSFIKHKTTASTTNLATTAFSGSVEKDMLGKVASFSKIKESSATTLFDIALPTILALLGRHLQDKNVNVAQLTEYFSAETTGKQSIMPVGFGAAGAGAVIVNEPAKVVGAVPIVTHADKPKVHATETSRPDHAQNPVHMDDEPVHATAIHNPTNPINGFSWVLPMWVNIVLLGVLWFFTLGPGNRYEKPKLDENKTSTPYLRERIQPGVNVGAVDEKTGDFMYDEGDMMTIVLPNGQEFEAGQNSTEARLVSFLMDKNIPVDEKSGNWYEFTNVHFKLNSADLEKVSDTQLKNIVAITNAFPDAKFKFGGYTDNTGDAALNKPLSQKRAESVAKLVAAYGGKANSFVAPEGFGAEHPIADNETATGRAMNRRVAVNVKAK